MNKTFIIVYDITADGNREEIIKKIKSYSGWANITEDSWAVVTENSATEIRDALKEFVGTGGRLFVVRAGVGAAWRNTIGTNEWLKKNL